MDGEIELVSDGDGLAVVGEASAVERFMRSHGLWLDSKVLDIPRLSKVLNTTSQAVEGASKVAESSGRWVKLTEESARLVDEHGLMDSKTPGVSHLMIGVPGSVSSWLQAETGPGPMLTNPQALSGLSAMMAQASMQQAIAEVADYLASIDEKVDEVLAKVDGTVLKDMRGARFQIRRAMTMREHDGRVTNDAWSEVQNASGKIGDVQGYALQELERISDKFENRINIGGLAAAVEQARPEFQKWLAVVADCFQLQDAFDVLALDRVLGEPAAVVDARRRGLEADRQDRLDAISQHTERLLSRMDIAVARANARIVWTHKKSLAVVDSGNDLGSGIHDFHLTLGINADARNWQARRLGPVVHKGAQALQGTKDVAPYAVTALTVVGLVARKVRK